MDSHASKSRPEVSDREKWEELATFRRFQPITMPDMLDELLDLGFSRMGIAKLVDVSVSQVARWRTINAWILTERLRLADVLATCDLLTDRFGVQDLPLFFEQRLASQCVVDMAEIYAAGNLDLVFDLAAGRKSNEQVLDEYEPSWRSIPPSMFETYQADDGEMAIRPKSFAEKVEESLGVETVAALQLELESGDYARYTGGGGED